MGDMSIENVYTIEECDYLSRIVLALQDRWTVQDAVTTLGGALYVHRWKDYRASGKVLDHEVFNVFHGKLLKLFDAYYDDDVNKVGFHIFSNRHSGMSGSVHIDTPFNKHPLLKEMIEDGGKPFSFTIPIKLPEASTGIKYDNEYIEYELGKMYLHDGLTTHQISQTVIGEDEYRMTVQGHGILKADGTKIIYF